MFWSKESQRWSALINSWSSQKQRCSALKLSVVNIFDSEKIRSCQLWISAQQSWKLSNLWNSAVRRWLSLGLQSGTTVQHKANKMESLNKYTNPITSMLDYATAFQFQIYWKKYKLGEIQIVLDWNKSRQKINSNEQNAN